VICNAMMFSPTTELRDAIYDYADVTGLPLSQALRQAVAAGLLNLKAGDAGFLRKHRDVLEIAVAKHGFSGLRRRPRKTAAVRLGALND
jgi:hypothetical protein